MALRLYDTLAGVAAPYVASAFGVFLMRQTFRTIPREYEEAAPVDGATRLQIIWHVLLPLARPGLAAFAVVSRHHALERVPVAADGDLLAVDPGADGRARGFTSGAEAGGMGRDCGRNVPGRGTAAGAVRAVPTPVRGELHLPGIK